MTKLNQIYKCEVCGNIVEVLRTGAGELVCCGQPMKLQAENTVDAVTEKPAAAKAMADKHVPIIKETDAGIKIKIGEVEHPMTEEHYIEWTEVIADGRVYRKFLKPGDKPEAVFVVDADDVIARAYCNLHGLWQA